MSVVSGWLQGLCANSDPNGIRTRVTAVKGRYLYGGKLFLMKYLQMYGLSVAQIATQNLRVTSAQTVTQVNKVGAANLVCLRADPETAVYVQPSFSIVAVLAPNRCCWRYIAGLGRQASMARRIVILAEARIECNPGNNRPAVAGQILQQHHQQFSHTGGGICRWSKSQRQERRPRRQMQLWSAKNEND